MSCLVSKIRLHFGNILIIHYRTWWIIFISLITYSIIHSPQLRSQTYVLFKPFNRLARLTTKSSAVIMWSIIVRYYVNNYRALSRASYVVSLVKVCEKIDQRYNGTALFMCKKISCLLNLLIIGRHGINHTRIIAFKLPVPSEWSEISESANIYIYIYIYTFI